MVKIKIAVISDIHGNIEALNQIIEDAKKRNVDIFIASGDLVNELPFGNEVIDKLKEINALAIKGNKEQYFIDYDKNKYDWKNIQFQNTVYMYEKISKENLEYIKKLPFSLSLEYEKVKIKVVHGSPESITELIHKDDIDLIDKYTKKLEEDILVLGHTHEPIWTYSMNNKLIVNAGCAGVSPKNINFAEYVIIDIENGKYEIENLKVEFDVNKIREGILKSGLLKIDLAFINLTYETLIGNPKLKEKFFAEAKQMMIEKGRKLKKENVKGIYETFKLYDDDIWIELTEKYKSEFKLKLEEK